MKFFVKEIDSVSESLRDQYEQTEGGYKLKVELPEGYAVEDISGLKSALEKERESRRQANERLEATGSELKTLQAQMDDLRDNRARKDGDIEALDKSWQKKFSDRESELETKIQELDGYIQKQTRHSTAHELAATLAVPGSADVLLPHIEKRIGVEIRDGKPAAVVLDDDGKPSAESIEELGAKFRSDERFAPLIVASKANGGGATGGKGGGAATVRPNMGGSKEERLAAIRQRREQAA